MSRFHVLATITTAAVLMTGCDFGEDCCTGSAGSTTSLLGPHACGDGYCSDGEVCVTQYAGVDAGEGGGGNPASCVTFPRLCTLEDCGHGTECAPCVEQLCDYQVWTSVQGRDVSCSGQ